MQNSRADISSFALKIVAIVGMTGNHAAYLFAPMLPVPLAAALFSVGGVTFPIMAFLLTEGYRRTSNLARYARRLGLFALVSQIPFSLLWGFEGNVLFTLLIGLGLMRLADARVGMVEKLVGGAALLGTSSMCDWGVVGPVLVLLFHVLRDREGDAAAEDAARSGAAAAAGDAGTSVGASASAGVGASAGASVGAGVGARRSNTRGIWLAMLVPLASNGIPALMAVAALASGASGADALAAAGVAPVPGAGASAADIGSLTTFLAAVPTPGDAVFAADPLVLIAGSCGYALLGFPVAAALLSAYRGRRERPLKWLFYAYYPAHLLALWALWMLVS